MGRKLTDSATTPTTPLETVETVLTANGEVDKDEYVQEETKKEVIGDTVIVLDTDTQETKCPNCGSTEVVLMEDGKTFICQFCRHEFVPKSLKELIEETKIETLELFCPVCRSTNVVVSDDNILRCGKCKAEVDMNGKENLNLLLSNRFIGSASQQDLTDDHLVTLKCDNCGTEVTVDINNETQVRCHWCKSILRPTQKVSNGKLPDGIIPFKVTREEAMSKIEDVFFSRSKLYIDKDYYRDFDVEKLQKVYLPYSVYSANMLTKIHGTSQELRDDRGVVCERGDYGFSGVGFKLFNTFLTAKRDRGVGMLGYKEPIDDYVYEYKLYDENVIYVEDLFVESFASFQDNLESIRKGVKQNESSLLKQLDESTTNTINAILPFDMSEAVTFRSDFLEDATSEKRNLSNKDLEDRVNMRLGAITQSIANSRFPEYNRGTRYEKVDINIRGDEWLYILAPVWLYSYEKDGKFYYIAVNGQTGETHGSLPVKRNVVNLTAGLMALLTGIVSIPCGLALIRILASTHGL